MELIYRNKKPREDILAQTEKFRMPVSADKSMLFYGENFAGLSALLCGGYAGKIDLVYIDPPFNTRQSFSVEEGRTSTVSRARAGKVVFQDKFTLEEYLEFLRERIVPIRELLSERGSFYLHTDTKTGHYIKIVLDEIFGSDCFCNDITRVKSNPKNFKRAAYGNEKDVVLFYAKCAGKNIWNNVSLPLTEEERLARFPKRDERGYYTTIPLHAPGETANGVTGKAWRGILPPAGRHWRTKPEEFDRLDAEGRIEWSDRGNPRIKKYVNEHKGKKIQDIWTFKDPQYPAYPTQKNADMLDLLVKQSSAPDSIVLDCFSGSGTTLAAAERNGRRWIGMDKSEDAIRLTRAALAAADFVEYDLGE